VSDKRCELCGKEPGSVQYTEIEEARVTKRLICRSCAQARGLLDEPAKPVVMLQQLLAMPAQPAAEAPPAAPDPQDLECSGCGLTFATFRRQGRLGCAECYRAFETQLVPLLRKIHQHVRHAGKAPRHYARKVEMRQKADDMRRELDRAVRGEDYERAARVRDQLRALENEQSQAARQARGPKAGGPGSESESKAKGETS
jgi:protein arginine kinase activator